MSQSYIDRSRQMNVNWNRGEHRIGLFGGIVYFRQWYDRRASVIGVLMLIGALMLTLKRTDVRFERKQE